MGADFIAERTDPLTGAVVLSLKYPDVIPVGSSCEVAETRRTVMVTREAKAYKNNLDLVADGIGCAMQCPCNVRLIPSLFTIRVTSTSLC